MSASEIVQARREADATKARALGRADVLKERLSPATIASETIGNARDRVEALAETATETVKARPVAVGAAAGLVALLVFRKPVAKLARTLFRRAERPQPVVTRRSSGPRPSPDPLAQFAPPTSPIFFQE